MVQPETRYAKSGPVSVAYQVVGTGSVDLVLVPGFVSHVEVAWEEPRLARLLSRNDLESRVLDHTNCRRQRLSPAAMEVRDGH